MITFPMTDGLKKLLPVLLLLSGCGGNNPPSTAYPGRLDPIAGQWVTYGGGIGIISRLPNPFAIPTEASGKTVNYVYTAPPALAVGKVMALNYSVTGPATFAPLPESNCGAGGCGVAQLRLFIWTSNTDTNSDRWWCAHPAVLAVGGGQTLSCTIDQTWTGVYGQTGNPVASGPFAAGFTFGGMFAGHGVWVTSGSATFKVNSFTVQ